MYDSLSIYDDANSLNYYKDKNDDNSNLSNNNKINLKHYLETLTNKNLLWMKDKELNREEYKKHFVEDKILDCQLNETSNLPIPIYLIYKVLFDYNFKSKKDSSGNFIQALQNIRNEYDKTFKEINFDSKKIPTLFKNNIEETYRKFLKHQNSNDINEFIEQCNKEYPVLMEYNYKYTHPIPKPVFMGPKILYLDDLYRFFFISPTTFIVELKTNTSGFMLVDAFYTVAKYKFETIFNEDLSILQTKVNCYFTIEYVKDIWFKGQVESNGYAENNDYMNNFMIPNMIDELRMNFKEIVNNNPPSILNEREISFNENEDTLDNKTIYNESEIPDFEIPKLQFKNYDNNINIKTDKEVIIEKVKINVIDKNEIFKYCFYSISLSLFLFYFRKVLGDFPLYFILFLILLYAISIYKKLEKMNNLKNE